MRKNLVPALFVVLIVLQLVSLSRMENLQNDLRNTQNQLMNLSSGQSNQINDIYAKIDSSLNRQASIIDNFDYSLGTLDNDKLVIPVTFNISPKETKDNTTVTLYISDQSAAMNKNDTVFTTTIPVNIFDPWEVKVVIEDDGVKRTEKLETWENLRDRALPIVAVRYEGQSGSGYSKNSGKLSGEYHKKGRFSLETKPSSDGNIIEKAHLILDIDGNTISEKPIENIAVPVVIDEKLTLTAGQTFTIMVAVTDNIGLTYKTTVDKLKLDSNADPIHDREWAWMGDMTISSKDGTVLYEP